MKASCGKRSCCYFTDKSDNIEPSAAHNILLRPRIGDTTGLLESVIHQHKFFKYNKCEHAFLSIMTVLCFTPPLPAPYLFRGKKKIHSPGPFLPQIFGTLRSIYFGFLREKKGYFNDFPGDSDTYTPYHFQICFKMPVFFKVIGIPKQ